MSLNHTVPYYTRYLEEIPYWESGETLERPAHRGVNDPPWAFITRHFVCGTGLPFRACAAPPPAHTPAPHAAASAAPVRLRRALPGRHPPPNRRACATPRPLPGFRSEPLPGECGSCRRRSALARSSAPPLAARPLSASLSLRGSTARSGPHLGARTAWRRRRA